MNFTGVGNIYICVDFMNSFDGFRTYFCNTKSRKPELYVVKNVELGGFEVCGTFFAGWIKCTLLHFRHCNHWIYAVKLSETFT
jgi:hypothetical protein